MSRTKSVRNELRGITLIGSVFIVAVAVLSGCASAASSLESFEGEIREVTLSFDGTERSYLVVDGAAPGEAAPVVLALHGADARSVEDFLLETGWHEKALDEGFVAVFPVGTRSGGRYQWNALACCGAAARDGLDDVGFVLAVAQDVAANRSVDPDRIYLTGKSNGAMLTSQIAAMHGERFAAVATVVGTVFEDAQPVGGPVPIMMVNVQDDPLIPYAADDEAGFIARRLIDQQMLGAVQSAAYWAEANGSSRTAERTTDGENYQDLYTASDDGAKVLFVSIAEGGHIWPRDGYDGTEGIWSFFQEHS